MDRYDQALGRAISTTLVLLGRRRSRAQPSPIIAATEEASPAPERRLLVTCSSSVQWLPRSADLHVCPLAEEPAGRAALLVDEGLGRRLADARVEVGVRCAGQADEALP